MPIEKGCTQCGETKALEEFHRHKRNGRYAACKVCRRAKNAAYRAANADKERARKAAWQAANREKARARDAAWYAANREKKRARIAAWQAANREKARASTASYRAANRDKVRAANAAYRAANPEKGAVLGAKRRARKRNALGPHHTAAEFAAIVKRQKNRCLDCGIEFGPKGEGATRGHLVPLVLGGTNAALNIAAQCLSCNCKQGRNLHPSVRGLSLFDAVGL